MYLMKYSLIILMGYKFIDKYSLLHFTSGIVAYYLGIKFWYWFLIHLLFEIIENSTCGMNIINKLYFWPGGKETADNLINSTGDQLFAMLGWLIAQKLFVV
jgi:hypothetical protein